MDDQRTRDEKVNEAEQSRTAGAPRGAARADDVSVPTPAGGSATKGEAVGGGMSDSAVGGAITADADPGGGGDLTGEVADTAAGADAADPAASGLGDTAAGSNLRDFAAAFERRHRQHG